MAKPKPRTPGQNRKIWAIAGKIARASGGGREEQTDLVRSACKAVSMQDRSSRLNRAQADEVIALLRRRQGDVEGGPSESVSSREPTGGRVGPITPRQQEVLQALFHQVGMADRKQQIGFCRRQCKTPWPQSQEDADKLMEPLKAMALRHVSPEQAWRRAQHIAGHPLLDAWQRSFIPDLISQFEEAQAAGELDKVLSPHKLLKLVEAEVKCGVTP